tara:strand:- start:115 stop:1083 length:969 start_codon:yes stop_codon:yes gene_type:complete
MLRAETPQEQFNLIGAGRRNVFINGDFSVAQRGAGPTTGISGYPTVDRWIIPLSGETTQQLANDRVSTPSKMLKVTAATNGYGIIRQMVEDVSTLSGGYATLSFWAKTSTANNFRVEFQQLFGSGGSSTVSIIDDADYWKVPDDGWNFYSITVYLPSTLGKTVGTGSPGLSVLFGPTSGQPNGNIVYYSEVQLERGKVATPFEHRSYGEELALCQRYFENLITKEGQSLLCSGFCYSNTQVQGIVRFSVEKRVTPSMGYDGGIAYQSTGETARTNITPLFYVASTKTVMVYANSGVSVTAGQGVNLVNRDNGTGMIFANAEL